MSGGFFVLYVTDDYLLVVLIQLNRAYEIIHFTFNPFNFLSYVFMHNISSKCGVNRQRKRRFVFKNEGKGR
jgi:hypothetical protein